MMDKRWEIFLIQAMGLGGSAEIKMPVPVRDGQADMGPVTDMVDFYSGLGMDEVRIERLKDGRDIPIARIV